MNVAVIFNLKRFVLDMCHVMKFILRYSFYLLDKENYFKCTLKTIFYYNEKLFYKIEMILETHSFHSATL